MLTEDMAVTENDVTFTTFDESSKYQNEKGELKSFRSWTYMITYVIINLITWGIIASFPVLFVAFLGIFQESRLQTSIIGSLQAGLRNILVVIPGYLIPIYGFRIIVITGSIITAIGFISSIFVPQLHYLYITLGIITSLGASFLMTAADTAPLVTFTKWRTLASILAAVGASIGFAVMPLLIYYLLDCYTLVGTLFYVSGIILQCAILGMLFPNQSEVKTNNNVGISQDNTSKMSEFFQVIKSPSYWCLIMAAFANNSLSTGCRVFLIDRAIQLGISKETAVAVISLWGVFSSISVISIQLPIINKNARRRQIAYVIAMASWASTTVSLVCFKSYHAFVVYCILSGSFFGIVDTLWYLVLADITSNSNALIYAYIIQSLIIGVYVVFIVPLAGWIFDKTNSYDIPYIIYSGIGFIGAIALAFISYFESKKVIH